MSHSAKYLGICVVVFGVACVPPMRRYPDPSPPSVTAETYRPVFRVVNDFPKPPGAVAVWKRVSHSVNGPFVEMILGSNQSRYELLNFLDRELGERGCFSPQRMPREGEETRDRSWRCVPGYQTDTDVYIGDSLAGDPFRFWISARFYLNNDSLAVFTTKERANPDSMRVLPPEEAVQRFKVAAKRGAQKKK